VTERIEVPVPPALAGERVDRVVAFLTGLARSEAAAIVDAGGVRIGGRTVSVRGRRVAAGEELGVDVPDRPSGPGPDPDVELAVVFADEVVVVVDKPAGLVVHPGAGHAEGTMVQGLLARFPDVGDQPWPDPARPGVVHRLDKGTSGLLVVARTPAALAALTSQLQARTVERRYLVAVWGAVADPAGIVDAPIGRSASDPTRMAVTADGRRAVTRYEVVRTLDEVTLLRCTLETGRTHQIRVHLAAIGHPVVGDDRYGRMRRPEAAGRPFLHAAVLGFDHPLTGERMRFESPLPPDLAAAEAELSAGGAGPTPAVGGTARPRPERRPPPRPPTRRGSGRG
jgi:23S rRNA pseudouridine1911/1915/1917 synthase